MEKIAVSVSVEEMGDDKLAIKLQVGNSTSYLGANEALVVAEALAEASGYVEGYNHQAGITEPEVQFQREKEEQPEVELMGLREFLEALGDSLEEEAPVPKKHLH